MGSPSSRRYPDLLAGRRANAGRYDRAIADLPGLLPAPRASWADPSFWLYTARIDPTSTSLSRDALIDRLALDGIEARPIWTPLHRTGLYRDAPMLGGSVADSIFETAVSLPSSSSLGPAGSDRVIEALKRAVAKP